MHAANYEAIVEPHPIDKVYLSVRNHRQCFLFYMQQGTLTWGLFSFSFVLRLLSSPYTHHGVHAMW